MLSPVLTLASLLCASPPAVDYLRDVKPVLGEKCFACHGALQQKAELRLDTARAMLDGGNHGPAVAPGDSAASRILAHVEARGVPRMPPLSEGEALKPEQVARLRAWIDQGAPAPADEKPEIDPRE